MSKIYQRKVIFFPLPGENHSPSDYIKSLSAAEQAGILNKLNALSQIPQKDWVWTKKVQDLIQMKHGNHRLYLYPDENTIVVYYACLKQSQKAKSQDIHRARANLERYLNQ